MGAPNNESVYVFEESGGSWVQRARIAPSFSGHAVSLDGNRAVISGDGVLVYEWNGSSWVQRARLIPDEGPTGWFGHSVSVSGDRVIVGSPGDGNGGSAFLFEKSGSTWVQRAKLVAGDRATGDGFGFSVAIDGSFVVIGATGDDLNHTESNSGSAYVFERSGSTWVQRAKLAPADGKKDDFFGYTVSVSGNHIVVGAPYQDEGASNAGAAYIYDRGGSQWVLREKLIASDASTNGDFGWSVGMSGERALVGSPSADGSAVNVGAAYVYDL